MSGWHEIALFALFGFLFAWIGSYCINLIRVPPILWREQNDALNRINNENTQLKRALIRPIDPKEKRREELVLQKLRRYNQQERAVLQFILDHGEASHTMLLRAAFNPAVIDEAIAKGTGEDGLINAQENPDRYSINPAFQSALASILPNIEPSSDLIKN